MERRIITFAGRKGSGKSYLSERLSEKLNGTRLSFADSLKQICCGLLSFCCDSDITIDELKFIKDHNYTLDIHSTSIWLDYLNEQTGINKDEINKTLEDIQFHNVRQLLQVIGTDLIRKYSPDWHVRKTMEQIEKTSIDVPIVIDDLRFPNEKQMLEKYHADIYYVIRPNLFDYSNHISERSLNYRDFDNEHIIVNNKDVTALNELVDRYCETNSFVDASTLEQLDIDKDEYIEELTNAIPKLYKTDNPLDAIKMIDNIFVLEDLKLILNLKP